MPLKQNVDLKTRHAYQPGKEANLIPSPFGEGQTGMPIDRHPQGEVPLQNVKPLMDWNRIILK